MAKSQFNIPSDFKRFQRMVVLSILGLLGLVFVLSSWFTIGTEEVGVVLRLGKYNRTVGSGLNFKIPFGVETLYKLPVERQLKQEFGFRTLQAGVNTRYSQERFDTESLMLTGDLNLADVEWVVQYRISDPYQFLFKVRNPEKTLRDIAESAMRTVVGDRTVNEVLTVGRTEVASTAEAKMQALCNEYEIGIKVEQIVLQDVTPPEPVKPSFNGVNEAQQERERLINVARSEYNKVIPKATGQAEETISKAEGYALERVNRAKGEVSRFNSLYTEYARAPEVFRKRIYLETMETILPKIGTKIITTGEGNGVLPLLNMQTSQAKKGAQQ